MKTCWLVLLLFSLSLFVSCTQPNEDYYQLTHAELKNKINGAWAVQTIGVTFGGPTEFKYNKRMIPDSVNIQWSDTMMLYWMKNIPGLYDDIYMDLTFVEVLEKEGMDAPATSFGKAYAEASYWLWHANQQGRFNILNGIQPPESGHWLNNPHADDIDFQIEADFAGIMNPGMPNSAAKICDKVGHIMNYGDGYYGGVFVAAMYSFAFVEKDVRIVVEKALEVIPKESTFHQCISDVIQWSEQYPEDWKQNWQLIEEKWGEDIGCPDGVRRDFNIDAKINSAYVVLGLLYGNGDLTKTLDISTRAGKDSDCNPATAGAVLGTVLGYSAIPEYWAKGLPLVEDIDFQYTNLSLNEVYEISYRHALEMIKRNGGELTDEFIKIKKQAPKVVPLEQNFPGYSIKELIPVKKRITVNDQQTIELEFEGNGVVLKGRVHKLGNEDAYALITPEETLNFHKVKTEFYLDGELAKEMTLPLYFIERAHELFFQYELPDGPHKLEMKILEMHEDAYVDVWDLIVYEK